MCGMVHIWTNHRKRHGTNLWIRRKYSDLRMVVQMCSLVDVARNTEKPEQTLIGFNLERLLEKHKLSARALAARTEGRNGEVSHVDIGRIIRGETPDPSGNKLKAMADAMGEDISVFWASKADPAEMDPSIKAFVESGLAPDISEQDIIDLSSSRWRLDGAPPSKIRDRQRRVGNRLEWRERGNRGRASEVRPAAQLLVAIAALNRRAGF